MSPSLAAVPAYSVLNTSFRPQLRGGAQVSQTKPKPKPKPEFWAVSVLGAGIGPGMGFCRTGGQRDWLDWAEAQGWVTLAPRCMHWPPPRHDIDSTIRRVRGAVSDRKHLRGVDAWPPAAGPISTHVSVRARELGVALAPWQ